MNKFKVGDIVTHSRREGKFRITDADPFVCHATKIEGIIGLSPYFRLDPAFLRKEGHSIPLQFL